MKSTSRWFLFSISQKSHNTWKYKSKWHLAERSDIFPTAFEAAQDTSIINDWGEESKIVPKKLREENVHTNNLVQPEVSENENDLNSMLQLRCGDSLHFHFFDNLITIKKCPYVRGPITPPPKSKPEGWGSMCVLRQCTTTALHVHKPHPKWQGYRAVYTPGQDISC